MPVNTDSLLMPDEIAELVLLAHSSPISGCLVEVGVYRGGSAKHLLDISRNRDTKLYLYDTFAGIPFSNKDKGDTHIAGDFSDIDFETIKQNLPGAVLCKGIFPSTLVDMGKISFIHCDCDQYQSVLDTIDYLYPLLLDKGIMLFDDYHYLKGAANAVNERFTITETTKHNKAIVRKGITVKI
jgi:O-methyltransferase